MTRLLIAASGTGGHLFGLAVAEAVDRWPSALAGGTGPAGNELVPNVWLITVNAGGLQGRGLKKLLQLIRLLLASVSVRRVIRRESINAVFTTGGYIAAPRSWRRAGAAFPWCCMSRMPSLARHATAGRAVQCRRHSPAAAQRIPGSQPIVTGTPCRLRF